MSKLLKTIIIDDEAIGLQRLKRLLGTYQLFDVVAEASNGREGLELIESLKPDVIFLDIEMPVMNGFDMLRLVMHHPKVIFTTAFDQYAIKAFEENSIDYLLKPIEKERLDLTVNKLQSATTNTPDLHVLQTLIDSIKPKAEILTADLLIFESSLFTGTFSASISPLTMPATSSELPAREVLDELEVTAMI